MSSENFNKNLFSTSFDTKKRTYFFDVKKTKNGDLYLTITESVKKFDRLLGKVVFEKHKIFLYEENLEDFVEALNRVIENLNELKR